MNQGLKNWHKKAKRSLSKNSNSASLHSKTNENSVRGSLEELRNNEDIITPNSANNSGSGEEEEVIVAAVEKEIPSESTSEENGKIITRGIYDGEISFGIYVGSSSRGIGEIVAIAEEE